MIIKHGTETIEINIIRSKRKTASLRIKQDGTVEVRGPRLMSDAFVRDFVRAKSDWIIQKRKEVIEHQKKKRTHDFKSGDVFQYLGEEYVLTLVAAGRKRVELLREEPNKMMVHTTSFEPKAVEKQIKEWYKNQVTTYIEERVAYYSQMIPGKVASITMENRKTRWGSCNSRGELTLNWRLIMAPPEIIDYVVVHEMCHLKHMDHSKEFWRAVGSVLPDYKVRVKWLKENGISLNF